MTGERGCGGESTYTVKKASDFPFPSRDVTNQTLLGRGDGKMSSFFYSVEVITWNTVSMAIEKESKLVGGVPASKLKVPPNSCQIVKKNDGMVIEELGDGCGVAKICVWHI
jgi:hypothetical protein